MPSGPTLRIVHVNDVYSLENLPRLATLVKRYAAEAPADAFLAVLGGDFLSPSMLSSLDHGKGMVECLNAVGITHVIFGNHEDDIPVTEVRKRIAEFRGTWLSTNMRELDPQLQVSQVVEVAHQGGRTVRVGLLGVVMTDATVYRRPPFGGTKLDPANASVLREALLLREAHPRCDLVIPITHQSMADDRALIRDSQTAPFPLILGGHEHDVHVEQDLGTWLVKVGSEAERAAVIELEWPETPPTDGTSDSPTVAVRLEPVADYAEDASVRALVDRLMKQVKELESAVLLPLQDGQTLSSVGSRASQVSMGTMVCSHARDSLHAEVCLVNGGGIRAAREYTSHLSYGDIKAELPFDNEMVVVAMPGSVVRDAVAASRARVPLESGGFLQVDDHVKVDASGAVVTHLAGAPIDLYREYHVALVRAFFTGMDHEEPLVTFAATHPERIPPATTGRELKEVLVEGLALDLWRRLGGIDALDSDGDGVVTEADLAAGITKLCGAPASPLTVTLVACAVDKNHDHRISREESDLAFAG